MMLPPRNEFVERPNLTTTPRYERRNLAPYMSDAEPDALNAAFNTA